MKYVSIVILLVLFTNCKNDSRQENSDAIEETKPYVEDTLGNSRTDFETQEKSIAIELKQKALINKKDQRDELQQLIIEKNDINETDDYTINFSYPLLNETLNPRNRNFNDFMKNYYVNVSKTIADINENKLLCDSIAAKNFREERFIDYKIYSVNDQLVSVLFYKENFYSGAMHPSYSFDCFNFNLKKGAFMKFEDFFVQGSEDEVLSIINTKIKNKIQKGDLYYDCWEVDSNDFFASKNNFVLNDTFLEFYFDDCVMCPSYTGTYSIELALTDLQSVLKKSNSSLLVF